MDRVTFIWPPVAAPGFGERTVKLDRRASTARLQVPSLAGRLDLVRNAVMLSARTSPKGTYVRAITRSRIVRCLPGGMGRRWPLAGGSGAGGRRPQRRGGATTC